MIGVASGVDAATGVEEISLYGADEASLAPTEDNLKGLDVLVFDVQDVGSRYYTYAATMGLAMRVAGKVGVKVLVLDRPNPIASTVEGGGIRDELKNFCGLFPIPQRHGMTVGELAKLYITAFNIQCDLDVVSMEGWDRHSYFEQTNLPWVMPSPNMPTMDTAVVYPGMCLLEGTNVSEGRGTTRPFELFGAPFVNSADLISELRSYDLPGLRWRGCSFLPMFQKHAKNICFGAQLHVTDRLTFEPYRTGLAVLCALRKLYPTEFAWRTDTYEFRSDVPAIDLLTGFASVREQIDAGASVDSVVANAAQGTEVFEQNRQACLLY
jgi:uncharacterized protein YbbC (DUF1343 family)